MSVPPLRIPYGVADFYKLRTRGHYFVDKTEYLPLLEQSGEFLFLIRPRRFGKSLLQSVMECYYDSYWEPYFDELADRLNALPSLKPTTEALQRTLLGYASHAKLDAQGRVLLTPAQRALGKFEKDAVLIGVGNRYQLWRKDLWEVQMERDRQLATAALAEEPDLASFRL